MYATRNTVLQVASALAGLLITIAVASLLAPQLGITAIPIGFAMGTAAKVGLLAIALAPRVRAIGRTPVRSDLAAPV
jgi:hypothetical protein